MVAFTARYGRPLYKADSCGRLEVPPPEDQNLKRVFVCATAVGLVALVPPSAAAATPPRVPVSAASAAVAPGRGTAVKQVPDSAPVTFSVSFAPRNRQLLTRLARGGSARGGVSDARLRALFAPAASTVASTVSYLRGQGLHQIGGGLLTRTFTGSAANVEAAFDTQLVSYRRGGATVRAAASTAAYDHQPLLSQAREGQGNTLALVEFSNYDPSPVQTYQNCYSIQVTITDVAVNGGATDSNGAAEVQMDEEIAAANAPGLDGIYAYNAANGTGFGSVIDRILADRATTHANEISI